MRSERDRYALDFDENDELTDSQLWILWELKRTPCIASKIIANRIDVSPAVCIALVKKLADAGYLSSRSSAQLDDIYQLTDLGTSALLTQRKSVLPEH